MEKEIQEPRRIRWGILSWVVLLGVVLRATSAWTAWSIRGDGCGYLEMARGFSGGDPALFMNRWQHPLFPALISWMHGLVGNWILAGWLVGLVAGIAAIVFAWILCRETAGDRAALIGASLIAVHPLLVEGVGGILTESVYIAGTLGAVCGVVWCCQRSQTRGLVYGGLAAGIAYLTRPEGGMVGFLLAVYLVVTGWRSQSFLVGIRNAFLFSLVLTCAAFPLILTLSVANGYPTLSGKKFSDVFIHLRWGPGYTVGKDIPSPVVRDRAARYVSRIRAQGEGIPESPPRVGIQVQGLAETGYSEASYSKIQRRGDPMLEKLFKSWHPVFFLLVILGLSIPTRFGPRIREEGLFFLVAGGLIGVLAYVNHREGYVSSRHLVAVGVLLVPWAARGLLVSGAYWMQRPFRNWSRTSGLSVHEHRALGVALLLGLCLVVLAGKVVKRQGRSGWVSRQSGTWLSKTVHPEDCIMTSDGRAAFYAGGQFLRVPARGGYGLFLETLIDQSVDYLILSSGDQFKVQKLVEMGWLREIHKVPDHRGNPWRTYAVELKDP